MLGVRCKSGHLHASRNESVPAVALVYQECDCHLEIWKYNLEVKIAEALQVFVAGCTSEVKPHSPTVMFIYQTLFHRDIVAILLGHDKWKEMMKSLWRGTTVMRNLIVFMPGRLKFNTYPGVGKNGEREYIDGKKSRI